MQYLDPRQKQCHSKCGVKDHLPIANVTKTDVLVRLVKYVVQRFLNIHCLIYAK